MTSKEPYLTYAVGQDGCLKHIDEVANGKECNCHCAACKEPLMAKNGGSKRQHHFAHCSGTDCKGAYETMLHLLAKEKIQKAFLEKDKFNISYKCKSYCNQYETCKLIRSEKKCHNLVSKTFNLKEYYDSCEQEIAYDDSRHRSDLKIYSSDKENRKPIYIEFYVTHKCEEDKLHNGCHIIEIQIETEEDIESIVANGIVESEIAQFEEEEENKKISFYGFKDETERSDKIVAPVKYVRFTLYRSGKSLCLNDRSNCRSRYGKHKGALCEVLYHTNKGYAISDYARHIAYEEYQIKNCSVCRNYVDSYARPGKICRRYKMLGMSVFEDLDTKRAEKCPYFSVDELYVKKLKQEWSEVPCDVVTDRLAPVPKAEQVY